MSAIEIAAKALLSNSSPTAQGDGGNLCGGVGLPMALLLCPDPGRVESAA